MLHASGVAHCDLKPANIMLAPNGRTVLLDFGIVRIEQTRGDERLISGSPHFIAPEVVRCCVRPGEVHLVDVYALGVITFLLLTGFAPYDHTNTTELMILHLEAEVPRVRALRADVPADLDALIASMMQKDPADRPPRIELVRDAMSCLRQRLAA